MNSITSKKRVVTAPWAPEPRDVARRLNAMPEHATYDPSDVASHSELSLKRGECGCLVHAPNSKLPKCLMWRDLNHEKQ